MISRRTASLTRNLRIDQDHDQGHGETGHVRLEELGYGSLLRNQGYGEEELQDQQQEQEVAVEAMRKDDGDDDEKREQRRVKRHRGETEEISRDIHYSEGSEYSHDAGDEDDEDPRPAKRRKLPRVSTDVAATPPRGHSQKSRLRQPHRFKPSLIDDAQSQAEYKHPPTPADDEHHCTPRISRSPSATIAPITEYQEWPFQGFLKRTTIGNDATYNLRFKLPRISERLNLPIPPSALDISSSRERLAKAVAHSRIRPAVLQPRIKRLRWTPEEDAVLLKMR
jgi:hypothetical protein